MPHCPTDGIVCCYENTHNGRIVNLNPLLRSPSHSQSLLRLGFPHRKTAATTENQVRGWKSLNGDHKNALIVDITKQFRRNVGFKSIKGMKVVNEKNGGMVYT